MSSCPCHLGGLVVDQQRALRFVWLVLEIRPRLTQIFVIPYLMDRQVGIVVCITVARVIPWDALHGEFRCSEYILQPRPVGTGP